MAKPIPTLQEQLLKDICSFLTQANIPFMITGSLSVIRYGRPRASHDIDFIIEARENDRSKIAKAFASLPRKEFIVDPLYIEEAIANKSQFNVLHLPTMLKLDFWLLTDDTFDQERFKRKKYISMFGLSMPFSSPEDTILKKLLWYKESNIEKHFIDAAFVYQVQEKNLDKEYLYTWTKKQKTEKFLKELSTIDLEKYY